MTGPSTQPTTLTSQERLLRLALRISAPIFTLEMLVYLLPALIGSAQDDWIQHPFVVNSVAKAGILGGVCWVAGADVRRFSAVIPILIFATGAWVVGGAAILLWGETAQDYTILGVEMSAAGLLWAGMVFEGALTVMYLVLYRRARKARFQLTYLSPTAFLTLSALADVLVVGEEEPITPDEVAANVDRYMGAFHAQRKWVMKLALTGLFALPMLRLHPPFSIMASEERREFVEKRFQRAITSRRGPRLWRTLLQAMIRLAQQMVYLGYYSDPRTFESTGYVPFSKRERYAEAMAKVAPDRPKVKAQTPGDLDGSGKLDADAVVIGSGAAGALIAYRLAEAGRDVLVLERGQHVDPSQFSEDEVEQISRLYSDGALQLSRDFRFQVLQGMCVGGSTVVNNAVCFEIPDDVLARWNDPSGLDAGLDEARLREAFTTVGERLRISEQPDGFLNPGARKFTEGIERLGLNDPPARFGIVKANIADCLGCGYCNIGCAYGKKLSVLDTVLPEGQQRFGDRLRILAECRADRIETRSGRASGVRCQLSDGRRLDVSAETVIVAAGAINSSWLLRQSRIGGGNVGRRLAFNMGSPVNAEFEEELRSYDGLQISHYFDPPGEPGFVFETWFNPVVSQALTMPGWFDDHYRNMRRYAHLTAAGVLVGTHANARVRRALLTGGPEIDYVPAPDDLERMLEGIKLVAKIYLAAGAKRVMPGTLRFCELTSEDEVDHLDDHVRDSTDITLGSGHPQGGNVLGRNPAKGVVDPSFRVHGFENLHVCDASVFPSSITVNPQMTVMALAEYAAPMIGNGSS